MSSIYVDQSDWGCLRITGPDRVRFVHNLVTVNVETLRPGDWRRASMLTAKGRVLSVVELVAHADDLLLVCEPGLTAKTLAHLEKHAIMDEVEFETLDTPLHRQWSSPASVWSAPPIFAPCPRPGAPDDEVECRRVEAGLPRYGVDVDEDCFPFESGLREAIDYRKGCYLGQEPVARVAAQGSPKRSLLGLATEGEGPVARGAAVTSGDRSDAGKVTSSVQSARLGAIAMAYLHRSVWAPGSEVVVEGRRAVVHELPRQLPAA